MQNNPHDQHFVPVCYLRNFSVESEQKKENPKVWVYDKFSKRAEYKGAKNVCYSYKMYSISSDGEPVISDNITDKETFFESHYLHNIEQDYSRLLKDVIASIKQRKFGGAMKINLSLYIAIQYLRDPIIKILCDVGEEIPFFSLSQEYKNLSEKYPNILNDASMKHFMYAYGNKKMITTLTRSLATSEWTFHYNPNDVFYTSDNPVCLAQDKPGTQNDGVQSLYIIFPVSKNILLQIKQGLQLKEIFYIDDTPQWQIDNYNYIQAYFAKKYVISSSNSFSTIKDRIDIVPLTWNRNILSIYRKVKKVNH